MNLLIEARSVNSGGQSETIDRLIIKCWRSVACLGGRQLGLQGYVLPNPLEGLWILEENNL